MAAQPRTAAKAPMGGPLPMWGAAADVCGNAGSSGGIGSGAGAGDVGITGGMWGSDSGGLGLELASLVAQ